MAERDDRKRILDLLAEGRLDAAQAETLLRALGPVRPERPIPPAPPSPPTPPQAPPASSRRGLTRMLRIEIDADDGSGKVSKVRVNVPLQIARFAGKFLPEEARDALRDQGIDLAALIESLGEEMPEGRLVEIDADDGSGNGARIVVEVT